MYLRLVLPIALIMLSPVALFAGTAVQRNPPPDKPVPSNAEQIKKFEEAIAPYVKKARETLPETKKKYLAGLPKGQTFYVTIKLYDPSKKYEQVFIQVTSWKGEIIQGIISSDIS